MPFYISPDGNDAWSGVLPAPNADGTDGPFATVAAARRAVRAVPREPAWEEPVTVYLRGGRYELAEPLVFTAEGSGQAEVSNYHSYQAHERPVVYAAYPGETPVLSGGRRISDWRVEEVRGRTAWVADLPAVAAGAWTFTQLWVNGARRARPRLPKTGEYRIATVHDANFEGTWSETVRKGSDRFGYAEGDISPAWRNLADVEVRIMTLWVSVRAKLTAVDPTARIATLDRNSKVRLTYDFSRDGAAYIVENVFEALEEPGQWYLDRPSGRLYYLPLPGEDPDTAEVIAPALPDLLRLEGSPEAPVQALRFEGITFAHTEWTPGLDEIFPTQAEPKVPGAVIARHAVSCRFTGCAFTHLGTYAVELADACRDLAITHCAMTDLGAGGVKIWHGCRRNTVADCEIGDGGILYPSAVGVVIGKASGNRIVHNHIHDLYYSGVSAGWTWGYAEGDAYGNIIEWNHIHDLGKGVLSDMGGVYLLGVQPGTRVRYNHIHHVASRTYGGWALYTDEGSSDILLEFNLCHDTSKEGFHQHYGRENVVRNNIFAFGGEAMLRYTRVEPHTGFTFTRNLVISAGIPVWLGDYGPGAHQIDCDDNLYWDVTGAPVLNQYGEETLSFADWQALGHDRHSLVADPRCADLAGRDFTLEADSPAWGLGFLPFDLA
ncbi:MAG TPA: right-handed parallel beta-helix repeat-containing protein, partial [Armatimonadota bacterium]|nr:right-handed parallel beta-helix repeat-containing protein [Armatimonadota bacterium]